MGAWALWLVAAALAGPVRAELPLAVWTQWKAPAVVLPEPNAADVYKRAGDLYDSISRAHAGPPKPLVFPPQPEAEGDRDPWGVNPEHTPLSERVALYAEVLAQVRLAQAYRQEQGQWPAGLEAPVPQYLPRVPRDPFTDGPLRLAAAETGPVIYSVGPDGDDDGGGAQEKAGASVSDGDCVVRLGW